MLIWNIILYILVLEKKLMNSMKIRGFKKGMLYD